MSNNRGFHDFPRLAKESGFYFHFRNKKIEWAKIAELDVEDIANNRNFYILEEKMELVLNCELDEDITKVLDRDFVKLFKLAQLSVSYLNHCQTHLDRCVILLQEKLAESIKECETLRGLGAKQGVFQCDECQKTFLTANYLGAHQRRRHTLKSTVDVAVQTNDAPCRPVTVARGQQTDEKCRTALGIQTEPIITQTTSMMTDPENDAQSKDFTEKLRELNERLQAVEARNAQLENRHPEKSQLEDQSHLSTDLLEQKLQCNEIALKSNTTHESVPNSNSQLLLAQQLLPLLIQSLQPTSPENSTQPKEETLSQINESKKVELDKEEIQSISSSDDNKPTTYEGQKRSRIRKKIFLDDAKEAIAARPVARPRSLQNQKEMEIQPVMEDLSCTSSDSEETDCHQPVTDTHTIILSKNAETKNVVEGSGQLLHEHTINMSSVDSRTDQINSSKNGFSKLQLLDTSQQFLEEQAASEIESAKLPDKAADMSYTRMNAESKSRKFLVPTFNSLKNFIRGNSPKIKNPWRKPLSSFYEGLRKKDRTRRKLLEGKRDEDEKNQNSGGNSAFSGMSKITAEPVWGGLQDEDAQRTVAALNSHQAYKAKILPNFATRKWTEDQMKDFDEENDATKETPLYDSDIDMNPRAKMYGGVESDTNSDYSAIIVSSPMEKEQNAMENRRNQPPRPPPPNRLMAPDHKPIASSLQDYKTKPSQRTLLKNDKEINTGQDKVIKTKLDPPKESSKSPLVIFPSDIWSRDPSVEVEDLKMTAKDNLLSKIVTKPQMYAIESLDDLSSIESIQDSLLGRSKMVSKTLNQPKGIPSGSSILKKETDLSIFQVGTKITATTEKNMPVEESSDDESELSLPTGSNKFKSSVAGKKNTETKKRVVFADNFTLNIDSKSDLINIARNQQTAYSDSGSDWDIPM